MIGTVEENHWRTIAADADGVPQPEKTGQVRIEREAKFAWRAEAEQWVAEQKAEGFGEAFIASAATTSYYGLTDAPGNCWQARVEKLAGSGLAETRGE